MKKIDKIEVGFGSKTIVFPEPLLIETPSFETSDAITDALDKLILVIENLVDIINVERGGKEILE